MIDPTERKRRDRFDIAHWPEQARAAFLAAFGAPATSYDRRRARGYERWLEAAAAEGAPVGAVTAALWRRRAAGLSAADADAMRAVVATLHDAHGALYARAQPTREKCDARAKLAGLVARRLAEWPASWREAAAPLLHVDPDWVLDGRLVAAWAPSSLSRRVWSLSWLLRHAAEHGVDVDVTPSVVRAWLAHEQARAQRGEIRIASAAFTLDAATALAAQVMPERDWRWLRAAAKGLKQLARGAPSRNEARLQSAPELYLAGVSLFADAEAQLAAAKGRRARTKALRLGRAALSISMLASVPIRLGTFAGLDLEIHFDPGLTRLDLTPQETKEGAQDKREIPPELRAMLLRYVQAFRPIAAAASCSALFVSERTGGPMDRDRLGCDIRVACKAIFGAPVNTHAIRHAVATYIASTAPQEIDLASVILNHASAATTQVYRRRADQLAASRALLAARDAQAKAAGAQTRARPARPSKGRARPR